MPGISGGQIVVGDEHLRRERFLPPFAGTREAGLKHDHAAARHRGFRLLVRDAAALEARRFEQLHGRPVRSFSRRAAGERARRDVRDATEPSFPCPLVVDASNEPPPSSLITSPVEPDHLARRTHDVSLKSEPAASRGLLHCVVRHRGSRGPACESLQPTDKTPAINADT